MEPIVLTTPHPELEDALEFINTLEHSRDGDSELLPSPSKARAWLVDHHAYKADGPELDDGDLSRARRVRGALREVVDAVVAGRPADDAALAEINGVLRGADTRRLVPTSAGVAVEREHRADPLSDALAHLVDPLVGFVADGDHGRLRVCDDEQCRWVFYDASRTGRRRWCSMDSCGNRAKAARHRARRRAGDAAGATEERADRPRSAPVRGR